MGKLVIWFVVAVQVYSPLAHAWIGTRWWVEDGLDEVLGIYNISATGVPNNNALAHRHLFSCQTINLASASQKRNSFCLPGSSDYPHAVPAPAFLCINDWDDGGSSALVEGILVQLTWDDGGTDLTTVLPTNISNRITAKLYGTGHAYMPATTVRFTCTYSFTEQNGMTKKWNYGEVVGNVQYSVTNVFSVVINNYNDITVGKPTSMLGFLGERVTSSVRVTVSPGIAAGVTMSWDLTSAQCRNWNPKLTNTTLGTTEIGINHSANIALGPGENVFAVGFEPTEAGEFVCHGVFRFSFD